MKKIIVFFIVFFMMLISYYKKEENIHKDNIVELCEDKIIEEDSKLFVNLFFDDDVITLDLEEYVAGVLACEMPASFDEEALKAMSVAARTFALYKINNNNPYFILLFQR